MSAFPRDLEVHHLLELALAQDGVLELALRELHDVLRREARGLQDLAARLRLLPERYRGRLL